MSEDIRHECGVAALYDLRDPADGERHNVASLLPSMLLDLQTRGQLAAGLSTYNADRPQLIDTYKDVGTVAEVFRMSHPGKHGSIVHEYAGHAGIGHTRYATTGADDARYAQPFERHHGRRWKWFTFCFNGTLSNYTELRERISTKQDYHFSLDTDTEIIMHALAYRLKGERRPNLQRVMSSLAQDFDGAYALMFLDAMGRMFVARDPHGIRPMSWAVEANLFGAANESVALRNAGFHDIRALEPGQLIVVEQGKVRVERFAPKRRSARCFFEWVYFSNVASQIDGAGVYQSRAEAGKQLAEMEDQPVDDNTIVVPVPDTAKAAADSFAYHLKIPCMEGVIRNRYVGRTFIQPDNTRGQSAKSKYTPLPSILRGRRIFVVEDSIVRSTTLRALVEQLRQVGEVAEIHVRVACPPIVAPCFYGIDMSTLKELFAPPLVGRNYRGIPSKQGLQRMAKSVGVDSLRYLPVPRLGPSIGTDQQSLCLGCVTGQYPTEAGNRLMQIARRNYKRGRSGRVYD